jgi:hypothetical protein
MSNKAELKLAAGIKKALEEVFRNSTEEECRRALDSDMLAEALADAMRAAGLVGDKKEIVRMWRVIRLERKRLKELAHN